MPTGYTAPIYEGEEGFGLREYILRCSRAFGFTIRMRDEPLDKPPPREMEAVEDSYYAESLRADEARLEWLNDLSQASIEREADKAYTEHRKQAIESRKRMAELNARYQQMRSEVEAWEPPEILEGLKKFMLEQIDISTDTYEVKLPNRKDYEPQTWFEDQIRLVEKRIEYDEKHLQEEHERIEETNKYLQALYESLP